jgi:cation transport protein ChaC
MEMTNTLNRDSIRDGEVYRLLKAQEHLTKVRPLTDEERTARLDAFLARHPGGATWVFGYGSLIWNPAIHFSERRVARIWGYHRSFCLRTVMGRGTPDNPGLMLALDRGGSCAGVAYRLPDGQEREELEVVWAREMAAESYRAAWVRADTPRGRVWALTFLAGRINERYVGRLPEAEIVEHLARAEGHLGSCAEYLDNTVTHLAECGVVDRRMTRLQHLVRARREDASR